MDNFYELTEEEWKEVSWRELFQYAITGKRKDRTFTDEDIIRFFENNLDPDEMERVIDYFKRFCEEEELPEPEQPLPPIPPPNIWIPPPPVIPVLPSPPSPPLLPPPAETTPTFPGIIYWPALMGESWFLDFLESYFGTQEAGAAELPKEVREAEIKEPLGPAPQREEDSLVLRWTVEEKQTDLDIEESLTIPIINEIVSQDDTVLIQNETGEELYIHWWQADQLFLPWYEAIGDRFSAQVKTVFDTVPIDLAGETFEEDVEAVKSGMVYIEWVDYGYGRIYDPLGQNLGEIEGFLTDYQQELIKSWFMEE